MIFDGSPISSLFPDATLFVGLDRDVSDGSLRLYFGHRARNIHTHVAAGPDSDDLERMLASPHGHIWVREIDQATLCDCLNVPETKEDGRE